MNIVFGILAPSAPDIIHLGTWQLVLLITLPVLLGVLVATLFIYYFQNYRNRPSRYHEPIKTSEPLSDLNSTSTLRDMLMEMTTSGSGSGKS